MENFDVLNLLVENAGKRLVFVKDRYYGADVVGEDEVEISSEHQLCVSEADVLAVRESMPGVPVYGIWQSLLENDLLAHGIPLFLIKLSADEGLYAVCDPATGALIETGSFKGKKIKADCDQFELNDGVIVSAFTDGFKLDFPAIELPSEVAQAQKKAMLTQATGMLVAAGVGIVLSSVIMLGADSSNSDRIAEYKQKLSLVQKLTAEHKALSKSKLSDKPNQLADLQRYATIFSIDYDATIPEQPVSSRLKKTAQVNYAEGRDIKAEFPWIKQIRAWGQAKEITWGFEDKS